MKKIIGICGGMGPYAGTIMHQLIITNTDGRCDADHADVVHASFPCMLRDQAPPLTKAVRSIVRACEQRSVVVGVPCNSVHVPKAWRPLERYADGTPQMELLHMPRETAAFVRQHCPKAVRVGLLCASHTRNGRLYEGEFSTYGIETVHVSEAMQQAVERAIYDKKWGLKSRFPPSSQARSACCRFLDALVEKRCDVIVLGCTDLPLAVTKGRHRGVPIVNSMLALARALVRKSGYPLVELNKCTSPKKRSLKR